MQAQNPLRQKTSVEALKRRAQRGSVESVVDAQKRSPGKAASTLQRGRKPPADWVKHRADNKSGGPLSPKPGAPAAGVAERSPLGKSPIPASPRAKASGEKAGQAFKASPGTARGGKPVTSPRGKPATSPRGKPATLPAKSPGTSPPAPAAKPAPSVPKGPLLKGPPPPLKKDLTSKDSPQKNLPPPLVKSKSADDQGAAARSRLAEVLFVLGEEDVARIVDALDKRRSRRKPRDSSAESDLSSPGRARRKFKKEGERERRQSEAMLAKESIASSKAEEELKIVKARFPIEPPPMSAFLELGREVICAPRIEGGPFAVGEAKACLDDLQATLLQFYSRIYKIEDDIPLDWQIHQLGKHFYPSPYPISPEHSLFFPLKAGNMLTNHAPPPLILEGDRKASSVPKEAPKEALKSSSLSKEAHKSSSAPAPPAAPASVEAPGTSGRINREAHSVMDVISDLQELASLNAKQIDKLHLSVGRELQDGSSVNFWRDAVPRALRKPTYASQPEMEDHVEQLYRNLSIQTQWNDRKIRLLEDKLRIINPQCRQSEAVLNGE